MLAMDPVIYLTLDAIQHPEDLKTRVLSGGVLGSEGKSHKECVWGGILQFKNIFFFLENTSVVGY